MKPKKINSGVYKITNLITQMIYVGSTANFNNRKYKHFNDLKRGKSKNQHMQRSYNKHGKENFIFEILEYVSADNIKELKKELKKREDSWIKCFDFDKDLYNILPAAYSMLGYKHTSEALEKMSEVNIGKNNPMYGKRGVGCPNYGKIRSDKTKQKISEMKTGMLLSDDHKQKISKSLSGENAPWYRKFGADNPRSKRVKQIYKNSDKLIKVWDSMMDVQRELGINHSHISDVCRGKRKTAAGFKWRLV